jgi:UDPglucose 6-dehydrogenase
MGLDGRIGPKFLHPGPGYGGSCFPKDTQALAEIARDNNRPFEIVEATISANDRMKRRVVEKVIAALGGDASGKTVALLGLSFKPETDDMRESASIPLAERLVSEGARVRTFDPVAMENARAILPPEVEYCEDSYDAADGADALVLVTEWNQFRSLDLDKIKSGLRSPVVVDLRNIYRPDRMRERGFIYEGVGRGAGDCPIEQG